MEIGVGMRPLTPAVARISRPSRWYAEAILAALAAKERPATAQELFADLRTEGHRAGLATIYRALHALEQAGTIHAIRRADELAYRFCTASQHDHLICEICDAVNEIPRGQLNLWFQSEALIGFTPSADPQQIGAICPRCRATAR